jgi:restriction system protein
LGYQVTEGELGPDGGIDIELRKDGELLLVQCKQWKARKVCVSIIREMHGVLTASNANEIIIICSGRFTQEAYSFALDKPMTLMDGYKLSALIQDVQSSPALSNEKQALCPRCRNALVERVAKRGPNSGNAFLGCSSFPKCRYTE